jgi:hypothetical protein
MSTLLWIHADHLSPYHPIWKIAPNAPAIFVWDEALLRDWQISLKRIVFIYECLLDLPVTIRRGDVATEVVAFCHEYAANRILTPASHSPRHQHICDTIRQQLPDVPLGIVPEIPFVAYEGKTDLKRFYRFWSDMRDSALYPKKST